MSLKSHLSNVGRLAAFQLVIYFLLRLVFLCWVGSASFGAIFGALLTGIVFDLSTLIYVMIPFVLMGVFFPVWKSSAALQSLYRKTFFVFTLFANFLLFFTSFAEITFWNEFHVRFNFIAVDYLIYTTEVLHNIWESYHVVWLVVIVLIAATALTWWIQSHLESYTEKGWNWLARGSLLLGFGVLVALNFFVVRTEWVEVVPQYSMQEVAKNGLNSLFHAYFHNQLDFDRFYKTIELDRAFQNIRRQLANDGSQLIVDGPHSLARKVRTNGPLQRLNVIMVVMESMSAKYMTAFGNKNDLTPNLDRFAKEGLFFKNLFATGTRTVRGLEALMLSVPPTPGQSIVRRPKNEDLHSLGDEFHRLGYETEFLYGGYSYFDNMSEFFSSNGMKVIDRGDMNSDEVTFSNAWGVCDEDLYKLALHHADQAYQEGKPFFQMIMNTSNHRPYTYPQVIDIPSGSGRDGAVKYSDFAIGKLVEDAAKRDWFKNTVFIFVADHDAAVAGNTEVPVSDFRIPFIIYGPGIIAPQTVDRLGSQIDVGPTLLALLGVRYVSHFYGYDLIRTKEERAFLGTYQTVGLLQDGILTLLGPHKDAAQFTVGENDEQKPLKTPNQDLIDLTISYYQTASFLFNNGGMKIQSVNESKR